MIMCSMVRIVLASPMDETLKCQHYLKKYETYKNKMPNEKVYSNLNFIRKAVLNETITLSEPLKC